MGVESPLIRHGFAVPPSPRRGGGFGQLWEPPLRDPFGLCVGAHSVRPPYMGMRLMRASALWGVYRSRSPRRGGACPSRRLCIGCPYSAKAGATPSWGVYTSLDTPAAAAQTWEPCVIFLPAPDVSAGPKVRVPRTGGPGESGLRDPGGTNVEP